MANIIYHIEAVVHPLSQIIVACIPVYFVLFLLEIGCERLTARIMSIDVQAWLERKMEEHDRHINQSD